MFVDGPECFLLPAQLDTEGNILTKFQKYSISGLGGDAITRMFTDGQLDGQTDAGDFTDRKKTTSRRANNFKKGPQKGTQI